MRRLGCFPLVPPRALAVEERKNNNSKKKALKILVKAATGEGSCPRARACRGGACLGAQGRAIWRAGCCETPAAEAAVSWPVSRETQGGPDVGAGSLAGAQITSETKEVPENQPADIPCSAFRSQSSNPRIEWKFQKGSSLVLFYYGGQLTEPYKTRVRFSPTVIHFATVTRADTGKYICEVVGDNSQIAKSEVNLIVQVPPSKPVAHVPTSATIGSKALLRCTETDASPPPTFQWYKNSMLMPADPKTSLTFKNSSYSLDSTTGVLTFEPVSSFDTGDYYCEASNNVGSPQRSEAIHMEASEVNVGGIVAAVVVLLMVLALVAFGVWFAYTRGFFSSDTTSKKVIYSQPSHRSEGEFKQTSSFLV
ncbi:junctional adhesion molecule A [Rhea pennata]|uniref:junctional adhesion molecule A n=1 Tax=Rhea pennata TaxID=8795 RepID=UPI002E271687